MSNNTVCRQATLLPTVLGVTLLSTVSSQCGVHLSCAAVTIHNMCSKLFILKNYMRWRTRGFSLCILAKTQNIYH